jgi:hypothetical protein
MVMVLEIIQKVMKAMLVLTSEASRSLTDLVAEIQMVMAGPTPHKTG